MPMLYRASNTDEKPVQREGNNFILLGRVILDVCQKPPFRSRIGFGYRWTTKTWSAASEQGSSLCHCSTLVLLRLNVVSCGSVGRHTACVLSLPSSDTGGNCHNIARVSSECTLLGWSTISSERVDKARIAIHCGYDELGGSGPAHDDLWYH